MMELQLGLSILRMHRWQIANLGRHHVHELHSKMLAKERKPKKGSLNAFKREGPSICRAGNPACMI
jgi:hypothetical protein